MIGTISDEFGRLGKFKSILSSYEDRRLPLKMRINEEGLVFSKSDTHRNKKFLGSRVISDNICIPSLL